MTRMQISNFRLACREAFIRQSGLNLTKLDYLALKEIDTVSFTISLLEAIELHVIFKYPLVLSGVAGEYYEFIKGINYEILI